MKWLDYFVLSALLLSAMLCAMDGMLMEALGSLILIEIREINQST